MVNHPVPRVGRRAGPAGLHTVALVALLVTMTALCAPGYDGAPTGQTVERGLWGGSHMSLTVTAAGGDADFDCAHGSVSEILTLDRSGHFDVAGTFTLETGGPVREGQVPQPRPARYTGTVQGATMTVTISITGSSDIVGPFTLTRGRQAQLTKCL